jgi:cephalosporin hydroxylase
MNERKFDERNKKFVKKLGENKSLKKLSNKWMVESSLDEYSYHFKWLGRPIIQFPQDIVALQEIIWNMKPDLIIETGIARGGSLIFSASILELLGKGKVLGIDIEIRKENMKKILEHPLSKRIKMIVGSSIDENTINQVYKVAKKYKKIMVILDSNHSHNHVLSELKAYSKLVKKGSYLIVFDTVIEDIPKKYSKKLIKGNWSKTDNPKTAVREFLKENKRFKIDKEIEDKLLITVGPEGFLKCIK